MSGHETGGARARKQPLPRRIAVAVGSAVLVVLLASRFNRPTLAPGLTAARVEGRIYDVRDILDEADRWSRPLLPRYRRESNDNRLFGAGAGIFSQKSIGYEVPEPLVARDVEMLIRDVVAPDHWDTPPHDWHSVGWGGRVFVSATPATHRDVERLLALLRRGESEPAREKGASQ